MDIRDDRGIVARRRGLLCLFVSLGTLFLLMERPSAAWAGYNYRIRVINQTGQKIEYSFNVLKDSSGKEKRFALATGSKAIREFTTNGHGVVLTAWYPGTNTAIAGPRGIGSPQVATYAVTKGALTYLGRVDMAKLLKSEGKKYPGGCSEFVCDVLGIPNENANSLMGGNPKYVGANNKYSGLSPGDVVGWVKSPHGHVAIYIEKGKFIDVSVDPKKPETLKPRELGGYGSQGLYKSSRF